MENVHFIGIGGVGMNGLAQLAAQSEYRVSGSDRAYQPEADLFRCLEHLDIDILPQDGSGITAQTSKVVYSTAIEADNPDLFKARQLGIPLLHRAEFLKELIGDSELIAVAGTAGKTTTTGMLGWLFESLGQDPSVYNGAAVLNWKQPNMPGNVRKGSSNLWIIEADESDKSFLNFHPTHTIITNISKDHYELDELHTMFEQFREQTSGIIVEGGAPLAEGPSPTSFMHDGVEFKIPIPGRHNLENAFCAAKLCAALGHDLGEIRNALARFKGIERRFELVGEADGVQIFDDYAHNPAKISAALSTASTISKRVHAYWRPHGFGPLYQNMDELAGVFTTHWKSHGGSIFILPVYYAGGTVERKATAEDLVERLNSAGIPACHVPDYNTLKRELEDRAETGDAILGMGARDPELPLFAKRLVAEWKTYRS